MLWSTVTSYPRWRPYSVLEHCLGWVWVLSWLDAYSILIILEWESAKCRLWDWQWLLLSSNFPKNGENEMDLPFHDEALSSQQVESIVIGMGAGLTTWAPLSKSQHSHHNSVTYLTDVKIRYTLITRGIIVIHHLQQMSSHWKTKSSKVVLVRGTGRGMITHHHEIKEKREWCRGMRLVGIMSTYADKEAKLDSLLTWAVIIPQLDNQTANPTVRQDPSLKRSARPSSCYSITKYLKWWIIVLYGRRYIRSDSDRYYNFTIYHLLPQMKYPVSLNQPQRWLWENDNPTRAEYASSILNISVDKRKLYKFYSASTDISHEYGGCLPLFNQSSSKNETSRSKWNTHYYWCWRSADINCTSWLVKE